MSWQMKQCIPSALEDLTKCNILIIKTSITNLLFGINIGLIDRLKKHCKATNEAMDTRR